MNHQLSVDNVRKSVFRYPVYNESVELNIELNIITLNTDHLVQAQTFNEIYNILGCIENGVECLKLIEFYNHVYIKRNKMYKYITDYWRQIPT